MKSAWPYVFGTILIGTVVLIYLPFRPALNSTPISLTFLLMVLFTAARYGSSPAIFSSILAMLCLNYFFLPPHHTFTIADPQNWIALAVFLIASIISGSLSARSKRRAELAESQKKQIEHLYTELRSAFDKAKHAEALEQSEKLKSALLDAVSHDFRTPLTSMKAAVTTLLVDSKGQDKVELDEDGKRELLEIMRDEIDRLNHFVASLIELAKFEAGVNDTRRNWVQLEDVFSIAMDRCAALQKTHRIRIAGCQTIPPLRIDEKSIAEVLYILIDNATKYSANGTEVVVTATNSADQLTIRVEDQGIGIPAEFRAKVFSKFFSISDTKGPRRDSRGLGMGLAIARAIIEAHGGRIWIEDRASREGTSVLFVLPLSPAVSPLTFEVAQA